MTDKTSPGGNSYQEEQERCQEQQIQGQLVAEFGLTEEHLSVLQSK